MSLFDAYLMVDWSANSRPKGGKDSIWFCYAAWERGSLDEKRLENPRSRTAALEIVTAIAREHVETGQRLLVGFDFPFGFPAGLTEILGLDGIPWQATWRELVALVQDDLGGRRNRNNRFEVAAGFNQQISRGRGPFWGCPTSKSGPFLSTKKVDSDDCGLDPLRVCDRAIRGPKSTYQLFYNGSVGSQALTGIPRLEKLGKELGPICQVWPFETGMQAPDQSARVVLAEIYPSMFPIEKPYPCDIKDAGQVKACVVEFAMADRNKQLGSALRWKTGRRHESTQADRTGRGLDSRHRMSLGLGWRPGASARGKRPNTLKGGSRSSATGPR